jgi:hypothetical protein
MPVWRREGKDYGVDRMMVIDWKGLEERNGTIEVANDDGEPVIVHRYYPLLNRHNDIERIRRLHQDLETLNARDQDALEMLGHILKRAMNRNDLLHGDVTDSLGGHVFDGDYNPGPGRRPRRGRNS